MAPQLILAFPEWDLSPTFNAQTVEAQGSSETDTTPAILE